MSNLAANNINIAMGYPNVSEQTTWFILSRAVVKYRRNSASPQHELRGKTLLKAQGAPRCAAGRSQHGPTNTPNLHEPHVD
jgi:hypothetical protein